jgi:hypothetical protein
VDVHSTDIEREARRRHLLIVYRHESQVYIGLGPDGIVRQAAAKYGRQDRAILFYLRDKFIQRLSELPLDGPRRIAHSSHATFSAATAKTPHFDQPIAIAIG